MAIEKQKTLNNGSSGNYWRIISITANTVSLKMSGQLGLFKDKNFSDSGGSTLMVKHFTFPFTRQEFIEAENIIALTYTKIMEQAYQALNYDIMGQPIDPPRYRDADLVGGIPAAE